MVDGRMVFIAAVLFAGAVSGVGAQTAMTASATTATERASTTAWAARADRDVAIDGVDDDPVWAIAPLVSGFRQFDPEPDAAPSFPTEFRVAFDDNDLFVFVRAHDPHPDSIMRALSRRDVRGPSDQIGVLIDSYNDRRTGFTFYVNPDGVKRDFSVFNDAQEDVSWNGVWDVATRIESNGWTAEFRIPLSQLRFAPSERPSFGFGVRREIARYPERVSWPVFSRTTPGFMSQLGTLDGLEGLGSADRVEMTPYAVTRNVTTVEDAGFGRNQQMSVGGDLKVGLTPNLTLDATVNPDFGQVEADPAVLNLSAFETFLPERRPFFVEGTGLYGFSLNCYIVVDCQTNEGLFYSRRIGRDPSLRSTNGDQTTPTWTPIAAAAKLTGRGAGGLSFGLLDAVTQHVGGVGGRSVEPRTNYAVLRAQQDLRGGDAGVSVIATAVNRANDEWSSPFLHESAYVAGVDARTRFGDRQYEVRASLTASRVAGSPEVITRTQRNSTHYFQQPGSGAGVDSSAVSLSGVATQIKVGKYGGGFTRFESSYVRQSAGFDVNDLGYLRRADIHDWSTWAALSFQSPTRYYRWAQVNANTWHHWNTDGVRIESAINVNGHIGLNNNWNLHAGGTLSGLGAPECDRCTRGGPTLRKDRGLYPWFGVNGDSRHTVVPNLWVNLGRWDDGRSHSVSLSPNLDVRISTRTRLSVGASVYRAENATQWFGNFDDGLGGTDHAFAHLDQRTVSMSVRLNYTATPDLTFEFYGQPFTTSGTYTDLRELSATPGALDYDARFQPFATPTGATTSFRFSQLRTNTVLRWEYRPGSTLFLVWAHGREAYESGATRQTWQSDFGNLFDQRADHTFLVKVAYWINR